MIIDEHNFLLELKNKNPRSLEYIIDLYSNLVFKIVINILGSERREGAKECVNDIYLLIWNKHHLYNPEKASFKNWLLAVSKFKAIDYKRSLGKYNNLELDEQILFSESDIENEYILKDEQNKILQLLESENKIDKSIFIRKYFFDEDINLIAERFNLTRGAVYNRIWRTKHSLIKNFKLSKKMEVVK